MVQLKKMDNFLNMRSQAVYKVVKLIHRYVHWIQVIGQEHALSEPLEERQLRRHSWMFIPLLLKKGAPATLDFVKKIFEENHVETRPMLAGNMVQQPAMKSARYRQSSSLKNTDKLYSQSFMIGCPSANLEEELYILEHALMKLKELTS